MNAAVLQQTRRGYLDLHGYMAWIRDVLTRELRPKLVNLVSEEAKNVSHYLRASALSFETLLSHDLGQDVPEKIFSVKHRL
ncbi:hypothetical protein HF325_001694 [Metschnikowia pulcherrima]|uniref:Uncharacterized protein n=1 Tax=Metschnikowia pulcherrima TaxID=27326 RepID=A0A8H7GX59_9ASCO|nr:hypothetical protein HF325_001694 [Metschnikowia pulcherrima]